MEIEPVLASECFISSVRSSLDEDMLRTGHWFDAVLLSFLQALMVTEMKTWRASATYKRVVG